MVELPPHSAARLARARLTLDLPLRADEVLARFLPIETDVEAAQDARAEDPQGRAGVLAWDRLLREWVPDEALPAAEVEVLERAVLALAGWGLVQIVGQSAADPPVSGSAALRLTYTGRVALGLAPALWRGVTAAEVQPWVVLHGASREALLLEAWRRLGVDGRDALDLPVVLASRMEPPEAAGLVSQRLLTAGHAVIDACGLTDADHLGGGAGLLEALLSRTAAARGARSLLLSDPAPARLAAWSAGARLCWVEPQVQTRRAGLALDRRLSAVLRAEHTGSAALADVSGVPDSEIALPQRVNTAWEDLLLPAGVQLEFQQARWNAEFRLNIARLEPGGRSYGYRLLLSGLPGTGKSMAAEALATTLDRPIVRLDLSSVLSKWLGETEKLLAQVFDVAEAANALVVLDEAESLLRQRESGASGGHALATGVAYLLTRLDRFTGVLVATTNRTKDLDEAFFRRFDDFIVLPVPDEPTRALLWRRHLALGPASGPVDLGLLSARFAISGGLIRGAALRARAWSAGLGEPLCTPIVLASLGRELEKSDRSSKEVLVEPHVERVIELLKGGLPRRPSVEPRGRVRVFGSSA